MDGAIVVDKPAGMTSHDVVNRIRRIVGTRKVGHLGTLDPMGTGVLPMLLNRATRLARFLSAGPKRYEAVVRLGLTTDSYDREGNVLSECPQFAISRDQVEAALAKFRGTFMQTPPPISAKKIAGTPAYKLARRNVAVELTPVEVTVSQLEITSFDGRFLGISMECSPGSYVRSVAHDLGQELGCGAIVQELRRTVSGEFTEQQSWTLDRLQDQADAIEQAIIPASELMRDYPMTRVDSVTVAQIRQGRQFRVSPFGATASGRFIKAVSENGALVAIGEGILPHVYRPILVL